MQVYAYKRIRIFILYPSVNLRSTAPLTGGRGAVGTFIRGYGRRKVVKAIREIWMQRHTLLTRFRGYTLIKVRGLFA